MRCPQRTGARPNGIGCGQPTLHRHHPVGHNAKLYRYPAFTLIEVMLAVTILGLVITAVYSTWNVAFTAWKRGSDATANVQRERVVLGTLTELAQSAMFFTSKPELYEVVSKHDERAGDLVSFVTAAAVALPPSEAAMAGLRRVTLALERDRSGATYLAIANTPAVEGQFDPNTGEWHVLSADVSGFAVRYRDPRNGVWLEEWSDPLVPPGAIEFTVVFRTEGEGAAPLVVTRAVELPAAQFVLETLGQQATQQNTTNQVTRRDIDLSQLPQQSKQTYPEGAQ